MRDGVSRVGNGETLNRLLPDTFVYRDKGKGETQNSRRLEISRPGVAAGRSSCRVKHLLRVPDSVHEFAANQRAARHNPRVIEKYGEAVAFPSLSLSLSRVDTTSIRDEEKGRNST